jgi:predicted secreted protein
MIRLIILTLFAALGGIAPTSLAAHEEQTHYNRINLAASAGREVDTNTLVAIL